MRNFAKMPLTRQRGPHWHTFKVRDTAIAIAFRRLRLEALENRHLLAATPEMVRDIASDDSSSPGDFVSIGGVAYFAATDGLSGTELWKTDGSAGGTVLVRDIRPGASGSNPTQLTNVNGTLFFRANDGTNGYELWKSDGTNGGTVLVKDIAGGASSSHPQFLTEVNGTLYFGTAEDSGGTLWKSDGTAAGTTTVPGPDPLEAPRAPRYLVNVNGTLTFAAQQLMVSGDQLWQVHTSGIAQAYYTFGVDADPRDLTNVGGNLFFVVDTSANGAELWVQRPSFIGMLQDIRPGSAGSDPSRLVNASGTLYFTANDGTHGIELWKSDSTSAGTVMVKDVVAGAGGADPVSLTNVGGTLFFGAGELWKSDGTSSGTIMVKDIRPGAANSVPGLLTNVGGNLYFRANDGTHGSELWKSDGTSTGTMLVKDIAPGTSSSLQSSTSVRLLANVNGTLLLRATNGLNGDELWKSDGTSGGTVMVKDINVQSLSGSSPGAFTEVGQLTFFRARATGSGRELWATDGTSAGTVLVKDIRDGALDSYPRYLTNVNGTLYFTANDGTNGIEIWKSDGTSGGTVLLKDIRPGSGTSYPSSLTNFNGTLYFTATDGVSSGVWKSDGTSAGTFRVLGPAGNLLNVNNTLFITGSNGLWRSDGTSSGTVQIKQFNDLQSVADVDGTLFLIEYGFDENYFSTAEVWKSDGTTAGTVLVKTLPGDFVTTNYATSVNGTLFFASDAGGYGFELWKSDGTSTGTVLVKDIEPETYGSSDPRYLTNVSGTLFFAAWSSAGSHQLWKSDGTSAGTIAVANGFSNSAWSLVNVNGTLFFGGVTSASGTELWKSDGSAAGTMLVQDIRPGANGSLPISLTNVGGTLFFAANDGVHGSEPWRLEVLPNSSVTGRRLFYNRSSFDGDNASINTSDDLAIAVDKTAYLPGDGLAVFENVSSYSRGINGIMIDLLGPGMHGVISLSTLANDFVFKVGNNNAPGSWAAAPTPNAVSVRTNFDGSGTDRIVITWTDGDIKNQWLEVQVLPTSRTGLTSTDVFFWGNKVGDIGNPTPSTFSTTAAGDAGPIVSGGLGPAGGITNPRDIDRSNVITAAGDRGAATSNIGAIVRIDIPTGGPFAPESGSGDTGVASVLAGLSDSLGVTRFAVAPAPSVLAEERTRVAVARHEPPSVAADTARARAVVWQVDLVPAMLELDDELLDVLVTGAE